MHLFDCNNKKVVIHINTLFDYHLKALDSPVYKLAPHGLTATSHRQLDV